ncbi:MAG: hypothetical protein ACRCWR_09665 [Saezia sp.]
MNSSPYPPILDFEASVQLAQAIIVIAIAIIIIDLFICCRYLSILVYVPKKSRPKLIKQPETGIEKVSPPGSALEIP